jgi:phosphoenolpyruvate synthase/pyruvate phosphate dikinase
MILPFSQIGKNDVSKAGGKWASLGEMTQAGIPVPPGFVVLAEAFETFLDANSLRMEINQILENINHNSTTSLEWASEKIQTLIKNGEIPPETQKTLETYQKTLSTPFVAVRSSATAEDGVEHAWAGQLDTYLNVSPDDVLSKIQSCWASLFTPRALFYRSKKWLVNTHISVAVVVQSMVDADAAGVAFSVHPVTENTDEIVIEWSYGLGEAVVSGEVTPDSWVVGKKALSQSLLDTVLRFHNLNIINNPVVIEKKIQNFIDNPPPSGHLPFQGGMAPKSIFSRSITAKTRWIFQSKTGWNVWQNIPEPRASAPALSDDQIIELAELVVHIENHYGFPCDIEWALAGDELYILQARPITTLKQKKSERELNRLNRDNYIRLFSWDWYIPFWLWYDFVMAYQNLGGVSFSNQNIWLSYMDKKYLEKTNYEWIFIYGSKDEYEKLKAKMYDTFCRIWDFGQICLKTQSEEYLSKNVKEILNLFHQFRLLYQKTEFFYTDKIYELKDQYPDFEEVEKTFEYFKLDGRIFLNQIFFEPNCWYNKILIKITQYFDIDIDKLKLFSSIEIGNFLDKKIDVNDIEIAKRKEQYFIYSDSGEIKYFLGETWKSLVEDFIPDKTENKFIRWKTAYPGKHTGIAKIINIGLKNHADLPRIISQIPVGCVLVTETTEPRIIEACKKAGAIITNQWWMLSHAAITARELRIPCIVWTENATKVLKDGDFVEVDAENGVVRILSNMGNRIIQRKWEFSYERQMSFHMMHLFHTGYPELNALLGTHLTTTLYSTKNWNVSHYNDQDELREAHKAITETLSDPKRVSSIESYIREKFATYQSDIAALPTANLIDTSALWSLYEKHIAIESAISAATWIMFTTFLDAMTTVLTQNLTLYFDTKKVVDILEALSKPIELTPLECYENDLVHYRTSPTESFKNEIIEKYKHIGMFDIFSSPKVWDDHALRLSEARMTPPRKITSQVFPDQIQPLISLFCTYADLKEWKNFWREQLSYKYFRLFQCIWEQLGCSLQEVSWMTFDEVESALLWWQKNPVTNERRSDSIILFEHEKIEISIEKSLIQNFTNTYAYSSNLTGHPLGWGIVKGKTCIIISPDDYAKFTTSDVLVTSTIRPDQIHLIRQCSAIITNEWGLLSHAAIIARELKIPCIIGTKIATKVLKDGDLVEVDAENGVVKLIAPKS